MRGCAGGPYSIENIVSSMFKQSYSIVRNCHISLKSEKKNRDNRDNRDSLNFIGETGVITLRIAC